MVVKFTHFAISMGLHTFLSDKRYTKLQLTKISRYISVVYIAYQPAKDGRISQNFEKRHKNCANDNSCNAVEHLHLTVSGSYGIMLIGCT